MHAVEPGTKRWATLVREGLALEADRNWYLGDAALEIAPVGENGTKTGVYVHLREYAEAIGVAYDSILEYRRIASAWPATNRLGAASWKVHQILAAADKQHLIKPKMTTSEAFKAANPGGKHVGRTGPRSPLSDRVKATKEYLKDPEVAKALGADQEAKSAFYEGVGAAYREQHGTKPVPKSDQTKAAQLSAKETTMLNHLAGAWGRVRDALKIQAEIGISDKARPGAEKWVTRIEEELEWVKSGIQSGTIDQALEKLLSGDA